MQYSELFLQALDTAFFDFIKIYDKSMHEHNSCHRGYGGAFYSIAEGKEAAEKITGISPVNLPFSSFFYLHFF